MQTVAIIGASRNRTKFGNKAVRAYVQRGFRVYPVHLTEKEIEGLPAYDSILKVPTRPDLVSIYLPPEEVLKLLPDIAAKGCDELWLNPGTGSNAVVETADRLGLKTIQACSIVGVGILPEEL